jgi:ABC-type bacteriocin/lantibiotic exporter with double-glycine peptidase domain/CRP-like cAMP-binding protein
VSEQTVASTLEPLGIELLTDLAPEVRRLVVEAFERVDFAFGAVLMREGDPADSYWVLTDGRVRVVREGVDGKEVTLATLGAGATFGEGALLREGARTSTVRAATPGTALRLDASVVRALAATQPTVKESLSRIRRRHEIGDLLRMASPLARVAGPALPEIVDRLEPVDLAAGARMVIGGPGEEPSGPAGAPGSAVAAGGDEGPRAGAAGGALYLVEEGRLVVRADAEGSFPRYVRRGDLVGEAALVAETGAVEIVEAMTDARLLRLRRRDLDEVVAAHPDLAQALRDLAAVYQQRQVVRVPLDFAGGDPGEVGAGMGVALGAYVDLAAGQVATPGRAASGPQGEVAGPGLDGVDVDEERVDSAVAVAGAPDRARRRVRRRPVIRQIDEMDCGVAALAMVCQYHGKRMPLSRLRTLVGTTVDGTSAAGILGAARAVGFDARVVKSSKSALERLPLPFIAHWQGDHWVVVTRTGTTQVTFDDPGLGHRRVTADEFRKEWSGYVIEAQPGSDFERGGSRLQSMGWLRGLVRPHLRDIGVVAALAVALSAVELSLEVVIQVVIDRINGGHHHSADLGTVLAILASVTLVLTVGTLGQRVLLLRTAAALDRDGLQLLSERLLSLPLAYFSSRRTGDLQRRLDGLSMARSAVMDVGLVGLALGAQLLASVALLFYYSTLMGVVFCVAVPVYLLITRWSLARLSPATASLEEEAGRYASRQVEVVKGIETAKALAAEEPLQQALVAHQVALNARQLGVDRLRAVYGALTQGLGFAILAGFLAIGISEVDGKTLSIGGLFACVTLVALATAPMQELVVVADSFQHARTLTDRAQDVFDTEPEQGEDRSHLLPVPSISGHVTMKDVTFAYGENAPPVLDSISVDIPAGTTVAVVGRSGSGKTTLARCVAALVSPTAGTVSYDGVDAAQLDHRQLRRHIGLVLQETYLFSDTIEANIAFGSPLDPVLVREAAQLANAADFIERLPLGYETKVGESGLALSGGQRQRLAIARALYRHPALLVLDEATSALDAESERAIQENLGRLLGDRTAIIIAHRLSTVRHADLILVLDRGRLVEQGTHDELVARRGLYFLLTAQQLDL